MVPVAISFRRRRRDLGADRRVLLRHNGSLRSEYAVWFCKEPSPGGRGGKMLEETLLDYALVRVFAQKSPAKHASSEPVMRPILGDSMDSWRRIAGE
jgi:hypothetical protein